MRAELIAGALVFFSFYRPCSGLQSLFSLPFLSNFIECVLYRFSYRYCDAYDRTEGTVKKSNSLTKALSFVL